MSQRLVLVVLRQGLETWAAARRRGVASQLTAFTAPLPLLSLLSALLGEVALLRPGFDTEGSAGHKPSGSVPLATVWGPALRCARALRPGPLRCLCMVVPLSPCLPCLLGAASVSACLLASHSLWSHPQPISGSAAVLRARAACFLAWASCLVTSVLQPGGPQLNGLCSA